MNAIKEVFLITNKNISLATPLILYSLFSTIYLAVSMYGRLGNLLFAFSLFMLMTIAFVAGWFSMIKQAVLYPTRDDVNSLFKNFPEGVGEYFLPVFGSSAIIIIFYTLLMTGVVYAGMHYIGNPNIDPASFSNSLKSTAELKLFLSSLTSEQLSKLGMWNVLVLSATFVLNFILMLYFPALFFKNKNPLKAFWISIVNLFSKKILKTTIVYLMIYILYCASSICSALLSGNVIVHLVMTLLNFYFIVLVFVGIFYYYYHNFEEQKIGQNVDIKI